MKKNIFIISILIFFNIGFMQNADLVTQKIKLENAMRDKINTTVSKFLDPSHLNLTTDNAVALSRQFLSKSSQPLTKEELENALLTQEQIENLGKTLKPLNLRKHKGIFNWAEPNDDWVDLSEYGGRNTDDDDGTGMNNVDDENQYEGIKVFTFK